MKLPLHIAQKLQLLQEPGRFIPGSQLQHRVVNKMLDDGVLFKKQLGKTRSLLFLPDAGVLAAYLHNHFGIADLSLYVGAQQRAEEFTRAGSVRIAGNSKLNRVRTFSGFMANCYEPVACTMQGKPFVLQPLAGCFTFIRDYTSLVPGPGITIVGIENAENFSRVDRQAYLFNDIHPLFVSRYPQSSDLVKWLQAIPNEYLHFGDLDFEGINIYHHEFKKHLGQRARFFIPPKTEEYLPRYGSRALYNSQLPNAPAGPAIAEENIQQLLALIHRYKKVLEQEIFIGAQNL